MTLQIKTIIWLAIFSIAMGYMESAVVIYLRKIYYPGGFQFPLVPLDASIGLVELLREAATIIMLLGIATLSAKTTSLKFASFIFCFAVWDLCYYLFLWIFLGWPESLLTWDILFLIPVPWVGPVLAPCIISFTMLLLAGLIFHFNRSGMDTRLHVREWVLLGTGSLITIISFMWDYLCYGMTDKTADSLIGEQSTFNDLLNYVPLYFNWLLFFTGQAIILFGVALFIIGIKQNVNTDFEKRSLI